MFKFLRGQNRNSSVAEHDSRCLIELQGIRKIYKTEAGDFHALKGIDLSIDTGEFVGIVGKSGSGKSTLVNMITGIDHPSDGEVYVNNTAIHHLNEGQMAQWRGVSMGVVFQFFQLLPTLTVIENVMLPMDFTNSFPPAERKDRAMALLDLMDVGQQAHKLPTMISGGQQQRVAIARALANDPPIVVADEPTGNLDTKTANQVFRLFEDLVAQGKTFLMVTHDEDLAGRLSRVITIADGYLLNEGLTRAFPNLSHDLLLQTQQDADIRRFEPGAVIYDGQPEQVYVVGAGQVQNGSSQPCGRGSIFGANPLNGAHNPAATVRVNGDEPAEIVIIERETLAAILDQDEAARARVADAFRQHEPA